MQFSKFSKYLEKLEQTPSRLEMMYQLADLFSFLTEEEIAEASYLMQGSLVPKYLSLEFQLSVKMVVKALARLDLDKLNNVHLKYGETVLENSLFEEIDPSFIKSKTELLVAKITKKYKQNGDIGNVTKEIINIYHETENFKTKLSIIQVYQELKEIALDSGLGSQDRKIEKLSNLLAKLDETSAKFISRIVVGKLRLGFSAMTIFDALSWSMLKDKDHRELLENAYQKRADVGELAKSYLKISRSLDRKNEDFRSILASKLKDEYSVKVGIPVIPALCQRLNSSEEIIEKMEEVIAEPKYDGLRIQIHYSKKSFGKFNIKAFTRNLEDVTHMFPELNIVAKNLQCNDCILDAEAIGYSNETGELLQFQETITRRRKHKVEKQSKKVPIRFYVFDCLFLNNNSLLNNKLQVRKDSLRSIFKDNDTIKYTKSITTNNPKILKEFHHKQLGCGLEGAVMKKTNSGYKSGRKGWQWVKIKEEEGSSGKLKDTLDLVVMGYYFGRGKRSQFGIGAFLVGVLNNKQELMTIAKIGTGIKDEQLKNFKKRANLLETKNKPPNYKVEKLLFPDVWMSPELVVEIAADEITKSPSHTASVALRFPRLIKFRDDKNWIDATTIDELKNF